MPRPKPLKPIQIVLVLSVLLMAPVGGCVAVAVGAAAGVGTYVYVSGRLETLLEAPIDRVWLATRGAIADDLGLRVEKAEQDAMKGELRAKQADGTTVRVNLERKGDNLTEVRIRVGTFGNEAQSRMILDRIEKRL